VSGEGARRSAGVLQVVATPIGNLDDLSPRAARALAEADVIACEDTRVTRRLLTRVASRARLVPYHAHVERSRTPELVRRVAAGERVALVTDAGTPGLSDPGQRLVAACLAAGLRVEVVPGPSAAVAALVASGLPTARFVFEGFLPRRRAARRRRLERLAGEERTIVLFEAPHRLAETLADLLDVLGDREAAMGRELTKVHEEVVRGRLSELLDRARAGVRGEVTLVVAGAGPEEGRPDEEEDAGDEGEVVGRVRALVAAGVPKREAVVRVARELGLPRRRVYEMAVRAGL
jgi:16S rRNA (cytidine1402-2'-O)-methyltransferase